MTDSLMPTYARLPVAFEHGDGAWLWDTEGKRYLDGLSGIAVCNLGHAHPAVTDAICRQASELVHTSNLYRIPLQEQLAEELTRLSGMEKVFFANSGAEANEAAIKLARLYGHEKGIDNPDIIVADGSFHGRTMATLTATGNRKVHAGFEPLVKGFVRVPYNDLEAMRTVARNDHNVVAVLIEPVQGEGGVRIPDAGYLKAVRELCDEHGWLMMLDEVQTGMGRTGAMFAFQHDGILPDVMALAKGLGNGFPIGACLARGAAAEVFGPGNHGSTFGGNPLACAAALATLHVVEHGLLPRHVEALSKRMSQRFDAALEGVEGVKQIRLRGMMIGIELDRPCGELVGRALEAGLLINVTADKVVRLLPPLILTDEEADELVSGVASLIRDFLAE